MNMNETETFESDLTLEEYGERLVNLAASISIRSTLEAINEMEASVKLFISDLEKYMLTSLEDAAEGTFKEGDYYFLSVCNYPNTRFTFRYSSGKLLFAGDYSYIRQILIMKNLGMLTNGIF